MQESDALTITAYLNAAYPNTALDAASVAVFSREVALLVDPEIAMETAQKIVRTMARFPAISDFRSVYRSINDHRYREEKGRELTQPAPTFGWHPPEWVGIWWWATHYRDPVVTRVPAEMAGHGFEPLTIEEYEGLRTEWIELGKPAPSSFLPGLRKV